MFHKYNCTYKQQFENCVAVINIIPYVFPLSSGGWYYKRNASIYYSCWIVKSSYEYHSYSFRGVIYIL